MTLLQTTYRILLSILFVSSFSSILGQVERHDSINNDSVSLGIAHLNSLRHYDDANRIDSLCDYIELHPNKDPVMVESVLYNRAYTLYNVTDELERRYLFKWHNGTVGILGLSKSYPGMMQVETGAIGASQSLGNISAYIGAIVNKYGWYHGLKTQYGLNGSLYYQISSKLSINIYGIYYLSSDPQLINGIYLPPSMLGYYGYTKFGGYLNYNMNNQFSIQMGGQIIRRTYSNTYELEPIATPYIKVGKGKKKIGIGLPVGQIVNSFFGR
jgi:hypothetical protein